MQLFKAAGSTEGEALWPPEAINHRPLNTGGDCSQEKGRLQFEPDRARIDSISCGLAPHQPLMISFAF